MSQKRARECIRKNKNFLITSHMGLEGDALGSELAFLKLLQALGKRAVIVNEDDIPCEYTFLPGVKNIKRYRDDLKYPAFDVFVVLDCSDLKRSGRVSRINEARPVLNIDHHISNTGFGSINWIDPFASSCSEMVYRLFKNFRVKLTRDAATALYTGILTDTGSFRYPNTSSATHEIVSELLKFNLNVTQIYKNVYGNVPLKDMKLLAKIFPLMKSSLKGRLVWFELKRKLLKDARFSVDLTDHLLGFARSIKGVEVAVLFKENPENKGEIRVNLRSQGKIDVNTIAGFFGGGGHKTASGCAIRGRLEAVRKKVLKKIKASF